jgi:benzoyl-CoA reductase/2-hydroxyglutaryl-CoA dehydratase subunit BcrC/BadD/HgdB
MPDLVNGIVDWGGNLLGQYATVAPETIRWILMRSYDGVRWGTKHLPNRRKPPAGQMASHLALKTITDALDNYDQAVITSIWLPSEVFLAMGLHPVCAEVLSGAIASTKAEASFLAEAENRGVPATYCSYHRVLLGLAASEVLTAPRMLASCSVACDANNLTFKTLAHYWGTPHFYVDVPFEADDESIHYVADQLRRMGSMAEDVFGRKLYLPALTERVAVSQESLALLQQTLPLRRGKYLASDMGLEMQEALATHLALGTDDALHMLRQQTEDFAHAEPYEGLNIVWAHTPPYFLDSLKQELNQNRNAQIVASDMLYDQIPAQGTTWAYGPDQPFEAMAERLCTCCFNGPATRRADRLLRLARETAADGVVVFCHWGCKETAGASQLIAHRLEAAGYPVLILDGDGCDRANCMEGQMSTRFTAFLEMLRARREEAVHADAR